MTRTGKENKGPQRKPVEVLSIDRLEFLLSIPIDLSAPILAIDPIWDPLRDNPRFQRLLEQYKN